MELTTQTRNGVYIIRVKASRIDAAVAIQFKDQMRERVTQSKGRTVLDLENVDFIDSSGLGAIVAAMKLMPDGTTLELAALAPAVEKVFRMTRMDTIFTIHASAEAAVRPAS